MKEVHYIWIDFESSTGSSKSILLRNGCFSLDGAKKFIKSLRPKTLYENRPTFLKDCVKITLTAQNIVSSNTLYRRTINIVAQNLPTLVGNYKPFKHFRIMSTLHLDCRSQGMMESIIADRQERYSHVEFISWNNNTLVLAYIP